METYAIVRPEHLNHVGTLFGGQLLKWVDEYAWIAATRDYPDCLFATRAMDRVAFDRSVQIGAILRFHVEKERCGRTSATYAVSVTARYPGSAEEIPVFTTSITFVNMSRNGGKREIH